MINDAPASQFTCEKWDALLRSSEPIKLNLNPAEPGPQGNTNLIVTTLEPFDLVP